MKFFSWFRKKEAKPKGLSLHFEYNPEEVAITCYADWPAGLGEEADTDIVADFSQILCVLASGHMLGVAQQGVAEAGHRLDARQTAMRILSRANSLMSQSCGRNQSNSDEAIIPATECFPSRRNRGVMDDDN